MRKIEVGSLKPYLSLLLVILTLFVIVFFKMEVRRKGYTLLKDTHQYKKLQDNKRLKVIEYAKITRPERVRQLALSKLTMNDASRGQIIQMSGKSVAVRY